MKIQYRSLIRADVEKVVDQANFTEDQHQLFLELVAPTRARYTDDALCRKLNISRSTFYRTKKEVDTKVGRILT
jgi:hypothetical protein